MEWGDWVDGALEVDQIVSQDEILENLIIRITMLLSGVKGFVGPTSPRPDRGLRRQTASSAKRLSLVPTCYIRLESASQAAI